MRINLVLKLLFYLEIFFFYNSSVKMSSRNPLNPFNQLIIVVRVDGVDEAVDTSENFQSMFRQTK